MKKEYLFQFLILFIIICSIFSLLFVKTSTAANVSVSVTNITIPLSGNPDYNAQGILPNSGPTGILCISVSSSVETSLSQVVVNFSSLNNINSPFTIATDLLSMSTDTETSGVALYSDLNNNGEFEPNDIPGLIDSNISVNGLTVTITPWTPVIIPPVPGQTNKYAENFFIAIRTSNAINGQIIGGIDDRTWFSAYIYSVSFSGNPVTTVTPSPNPPTDTIICQAQILSLIPTRPDSLYSNKIYHTTNITGVQYGGSTDGGQGTPSTFPEVMGMATPYRILGLSLAGTSGFADGDEYLTDLQLNYNYLPGSSSYGMFGSHFLDSYPDVSIFSTSDNLANPWGDPRVAPITPPGQQGVVNNKGNFTPGNLYVNNQWTVSLPQAAYTGNVSNGHIDFYITQFTDPEHNYITDTPLYGNEWQAGVNPGDINFLYANQPSDSEINLPPTTTPIIHTVMDISTAEPTDPLDAGGFPDPLFGITLSQGAVTNETIQWIRVWFTSQDTNPNAAGYNFKPPDLEPLTTGANSGVSLWEINKNTATERSGETIAQEINNVFQPASVSGGYVGSPADSIGMFNVRYGVWDMTTIDTDIPLSTNNFIWYNSDGTPWSWQNDDPSNAGTAADPKMYYVYLKPENSIPLPRSNMYWDITGDSDPNSNGEIVRGPDLEICIRGGGLSSNTYATTNPQDRGLDYGDSVQASLLNPNDFLFGSGHPAAPTLFPQTNSVSADVPVFYTNLTMPGQKINPYQPTAVMGINAIGPSGSNFSIRHLGVLFDQVLTDSQPVYNFDIHWLINPACTNPNDPNGGCGLALYQDINHSGIFNPSVDPRIPMTSLPYSIADPKRPWVAYAMDFAPGAAPIPDVNEGNDYFLVIQPTQYMPTGANFFIVNWATSDDMNDGIDFTALSDGTQVDTDRPTKRFETDDMVLSSVSNVVDNSLITTGQQVDPISSPIGIFRINAFDPSQQNTLNSFRIYFNPEPEPDSVNPDSVLMPFSTNNQSGITLWKGNGSGGGVFNPGSDTFIPTNVSTWESDYYNSWLAGPGMPHASAALDTTLTYFKSTDDVYWYDANNSSVWFSGTTTSDALWVDTIDANPEDYNPTHAKLIAGVAPPPGTQGVLVNGSTYGFAYYDNTYKNGNFVYGDDVYFVGRGRDTLGYYADISLQTPNPLPTSSTGGNYYIAFRTSDEIQYRNQFSFSLPSNAIIFSSGYSFANSNLTTSTLTANLPVYFSDLGTSGITLNGGEQQPVIGIRTFTGDSDAVTNDTYITEVNVYFNGTNVFSDLAPLSLNSFSGVALYNTNGTGVWSSSDTFIPPTSIQQIGANGVQLQFTPGPLTLIPGTDPGNNSFIIVIKANSTVTTGDTIQAEILSSLSSPSGNPGIMYGEAGAPDLGETDMYLLNTTMYTFGQSYTSPPTITITPSSPSYNNGTVLFVTPQTLFTITAVDPPLGNGYAPGISSIGYSLGTAGPPWTTYNNPFNVISSTTIYAYAINNAGSSATISQPVEIDSTIPSIPTISLSPSTPSGNNGWYKAPAPKVTITPGADSGGPGIGGISYSFNDGTTWDTSNSPNVITIPVSQGANINIEAYDFDEVDNASPTVSYSGNPIKVDTTPPVTTINVNYANSTFTLSATDNLSGVASTSYSFNNQTWTTYPGSPVSITSSDTTIYAMSVDDAGNTETPVEVSIQNNLSISGVVDNYQHIPQANVNILLVDKTADETQIEQTNSVGSYTFSGLSQVGIYNVIPLVPNSVPFFKVYNGLQTSMTNQNFILSDGWQNIDYDLGNSRYYPFTSTQSILNGPTLVPVDNFSNSAPQMLTSDIDNNGIPDLLMTNGTYLYAYKYNPSTQFYTSEQWSPVSTSSSLSLCDSATLDTNIQIFLSGTGTNVVNVYNNQGSMINQVQDSSAPSNAQWQTRFAAGTMFFAGSNGSTDFDTMYVTDFAPADTVVWETQLNRQINPSKVVFDVRSDGKILALVGGHFDSPDNCQLTAINSQTGQTVWTTTFNGVYGKITPYVSDIYGTGFGEIIAVRTSTSVSSGPLVIYLINPANGQILHTWENASYTPSTNQNISASIADVTGSGNKDFIFTDDSGNLYGINLANNNNFGAPVFTPMQNIGTLWAISGFAGTGNGNDLIVSSGDTIEVLNINNLSTPLYAYTYSAAPENVIVSNFNNQGITDIIASLSNGTTQILSPLTSADLPANPTNLSAAVNGTSVYMVWDYQGNINIPFSGFKIYRTTTPTNPDSYALVGTTPSTSFVDNPPPGGTYTYEVYSYNIYGQSPCVDPSSYTVYVPSSTSPSNSGGGGGGGTPIEPLAIGLSVILLILKKRRVKT
jgi:hypothetical protein